MTKQQKEFLNQINREIKKYEYLQLAKKELLTAIENPGIIMLLGLGRDAESVTKYSNVLNVLLEQKENFLAIFDIEE